jgi:molecular chaperone DnaK (HSP70)
MASNSKTVVVGVDIGTESTKVVVLEDDHDPEIVRNEVGGHTTPTVISFDANNTKLRNIGATANTNARHNTVLHLNRLLPGERDDIDDAGIDALERFYQFSLVTDDSGCSVTNLDYNHKEASSSDVKATFSSSALLAMLLGNIHKNVQSTLRRRQQPIAGEEDKGKSTDGAVSSITTGTSNPTTKFLYSIACPPDMTPRAQQCLIDALYAGIEPHDVVLVERGGAYKASFERKFPDLLTNKKQKQTVLIVDMGHSETTVIVLGNHSASHEDKKDGEGQPSDSSTLQILSSVRSKSLGAGNIDVRLWEHYQSTIPSARFIKKRSKAGQRLLAGTTELKHQLSQLTKASLTVENVGGEDGDSDLTLSATQRLLADLCQPVEIPKLVLLLQTALQEAGITGEAEIQIDSVELVGGGCRIPFVKETIDKILKEITGTSITYSYSMDDASAALGAALVSDGYVKNRPAEEDASTEDIESVLVRKSFSTTMGPTTIQVSLRNEEIIMTDMDDKMQQRASTLNFLEARILELRSAHRGIHGYLLPDELFGYLDEVENWLFMGPAEEATNSDVIAKWEEIKKRTGELIEPYQLAIDNEQKAKEAEMEAEARQAELARAVDDQVDHETVDHDNRRLSKKRRMEIVMKTNKEGGEFFGSGDYSK